jgi:type VI secretion system protein ImpL
MAHKNFAIIQEKLRDERTSLTGPLLNLDDNLVRLSPDALSLEALLGKFLDLPFVKREGTEAITTKLHPGERLFWNKDPLQEAISLEDGFSRFEQQELNDLSPGMRTAFGELSASYLETNMADLIARSQSFTTGTPSVGADERINAEVQNFQDSSELLSTLLTDLESLDLTQAHQELLQITTLQAGNLLMRIDQRFEAQSPYSVNVNHFERWTGDNTPTYGGFEAHTPEEVMQYLAFQRQQVQQYAAKAAPLVKFLDGRIPSGGKEPGRTLLKWQRIVAELQKYTAKVPGTSLAALEDFISTDMDKVSPENCQAGFLNVAARPSDDYFVQAHESLRRALLTRCRVLSEENAVRAYNNMAKFFNQHLAGKFPFSLPPREQMPSEADPQDVAELFRLLDASGKSIQAGLQNGTFGNSYSRVLTFLNQLQALRPLFSPMTAAETDPVPVFDFVPAFRVNQDREINGNQIIDWTFQAGADTFHYRDPQRTGRWNYGEPVKLTLRWAKDSPQQPLSSPGNTDGKLGGRTVTFEYHDPWALFMMLALHQPVPDDFDRLTDPDPQTLVFTVNDSKSSDPVQPGAAAQAKVFVRLKLRLPGKPDNLRLRAFPIEAPNLDPISTQAVNADTGGGPQ